MNTPALHHRFKRTSPAQHRRLKPSSAPKPAVVVLGGGTNALSIARSLGRRGVRVWAINFPHAAVRYSRHAQWIPLSDASDCETVWADYLLGRQSDHLRGSVLLAASDPGVKVIAEHRPALMAKFQLDDSNPKAQLCMLDKLSTYQAALAAGVLTPQFWTAGNWAEIEVVRRRLVYPLIVKPRLSHRFEQRFGKKFIVVNSFRELQDTYHGMREADVSVLLMEKILGSDGRLCSYYTYLDGDGNPLFHFTKRIIRRYPPNMGAACYHITDAIPELHELGLKLFRHVGLRGLANVEFKRDERDGQYKLIECNARFTAANCLVERSGFDLASFVYNRIVGLPNAPLVKFRSGVRLWYPFEDFQAFRALQREGQLSFFQWAASILHWQMFPYFHWSDPLPTIVDELRRIQRKLWNR